MKHNLEELIKIVHSQRKMSELCLESKLNFTFEEIWDIEDTLVKAKELLERSREEIQNCYSKDIELTEEISKFLR